MADRRTVIIGEQFFADLNHLAGEYRTAGNTLRRRMAKRLRQIGKPYGQKVLEAGAEEFPHGGGLADRMRAGKATANMSLGGANPSVVISLTAHSATGQRMAVKQMDAEGLIRHPVYGSHDRPRSEWGWAAQRIRPHIFTDEFGKGADFIRSEVGEEIKRILAEIHN